MTDTEITFLLTSGGHNAGIVSEPGHNDRSYQVTTKTQRRSLHRSRRLGGSGATQGRIMVAGMGGLARRALGNAGCATDARRPQGGLFAAR